MFPHFREQEVERLLQRALKSEVVYSPDMPFRVPQTGKSGWISTVFNPHYAPHGEIVGVIGVIRDITERKREEEARKFLACIVESSDYAIFGTDRSGTIVSWNAAAEALFGYSAKEALGKHVSLLVPPERGKEVPRVLEGLAQGERISHLETTPMRKDGTRVDVSLTISPIRAADGGVIGAATIAHDISERKRAALELRRAKEGAEAANRAKSQFLANMSHEIRTPMNGVLGMTDLALNTDLTTEQREYLELAKTSADRLLAVINDILDFSKIEAGKLDLDVTPFDLHDNLAKIVTPLALRAQQKGLELICDLRPEVPQQIIADPTRLAQVVGNLLENAIKFTSRGEVELRVALERQHANRATLHFSVRDTGIGIPQEKQKSIFEAFAQADGSTSRRYGGTGLGLTISARLVEMMGGQIWVDSHPEKGSCFHFTARVGAIDSQPPVESRNLARLHGLSVLVADDNATSRRILGGLLERCGMKPALTASGAEALTRLTLAEEAGTPFDLAILDSHMPKMDGFEVVEAIRRRTKPAETPVLMLISTGERSDIVRTQEMGIAAYLTKPVSHPRFVESIQTALGHPPDPRVAPARANSLSPVGADSKLKVLFAEDNHVNQRLAQVRHEERPRAS